MNFSADKLKELIFCDERCASDIAVQVGVSHVAVGHWIHGRCVPGGNELAKLSQVLRVPMEAFFDGAPEPVAVKPPPRMAWLDKFIHAPQLFKARRNA